MKKTTSSKISSVPEKIKDYSQERAFEDIFDVMNELSIDKAHIVGLSMGGFAAIHFALKYPDMANSIVVAASGYGAEKDHEKFYFQVIFKYESIKLM